MKKGNDARGRWLDWMLKVAGPVLTNAAAGTLHSTMPVECPHDKDIRLQFTHLEALGRTVCGIGPWLDCAGLAGAEEEKRRQYAELTRRAIDRATDPASPDFMNFSEGIQPICDAAFLAHGMLRGERELIDKLPANVRRNVADCMRATRTRKPGYSNYLLFAAMIEALLCRLGEPYDAMRVDYALRTFDTWYSGDGLYGDGPEYCWNYYNSYVIQPMYVDLCAFFADKDPDWAALGEPVRQRARRYAAIQERLVNPDGSFPAVGRSLSYRAGAFQHLAQMALEKNLPDGLPPNQVRCALEAAIGRTLEAPGTFDENGWLHIGLCGSQPDVGEIYISTGSLYLCMAAFLPLGLPADDAFWTGPDVPWTAKRIWSGGFCGIDEALHYLRHKTIHDHDRTQSVKTQ